MTQEAKSTSSIVITPLMIFIAVFAVSFALFLVLRNKAKKTKKNTLNKQARYRLIISAFGSVALSSVLGAIVANNSLRTEEEFFTYLGGMAIFMVACSFAFTRALVQKMVADSKEGSLLEYDVNQESYVGPFGATATFISVIGLIGLGVIGYYHMKSMAVVAFSIAACVVLCALYIAENIYNLRVVFETNCSYHDILNIYIESDDVPLMDPEELRQAMKQIYQDMKDAEREAILDDEDAQEEEEDTFDYSEFEDENFDPDEFKDYNDKI